MHRNRTATLTSVGCQMNINVPICFTPVYLRRSVSKASKSLQERSATAGRQFHAGV